VNGSEIPTKAKMFFGGLHRWIGCSHPRIEDIVGVPFVAFGVMHIRAIVRTGGCVIGELDLDGGADPIPLLLSARGGPGALVLRGADRFREALPEDLGRLPVLGYWGYDFIVQLADHHLEQRAA